MTRTYIDDDDDDEVYSNGYNVGNNEVKVINK